jgi:mRNA interferase MazF
MKRGDVVVVQFPFADGKRGKNRPALIVQNDRDNRRLGNTVVAMITGNLQLKDKTPAIASNLRTTYGRSKN